MQTTLETAIQDGNVVLSETPAKKAGATTQPATLTGWAQHAEYHASDEVLHLTGSPRVTDGDAMQLAAERIDYHRDTQNATASGNVKATYTQEQKNGGSATRAAVPVGGNRPVHVVAERATLVTRRIRICSTEPGQSDPGADVAGCRLAARAGDRD